MFFFFLFLSPILFNCAPEELFRSINWKKYGIKISGKRLYNLKLADDVVLFAPNEKELQEMVQKLEAGLIINEAKTKILSNSKTSNIFLDGRKLEKVDTIIPRP